MAPKTKPKPTQPQKDFAKRPKAKVGKRAPSKLNATDTAFKTASVAVRSQDGGLDKNNNNNDGKALLKQLQQHQKDKSGGNSKSDINADLTSATAKLELASSRGNALSTLQLSLKHHAAPVRASGLKGIRDAVQSLNALIGGSGIDGSSFGDLGKSILESNLPSLIPNMCRCWLDEDDAVRGLALNLFGDILNVMSTDSSKPTSSSNIDNFQSLVPFVPLLCAYTSSALNSLDRSVRKDGALLVGMLASSIASPSFSLLSSNSKTPSMSVEVGKHVDLFLPSLERLLSSMTVGGGSGRGSDGGSGSAAGSVARDGRDAGGVKKRKRDGIEAKQSTCAPTSGGNSGSSRGNVPASDSVLLSIAFLLKASLATSNGLSLSNDLAAGHNMMGRRTLYPSLLVAGECKFLRGGSVHANSFMMFREMKDNRSEVTTSPTKSIRGIFDLPPMSSDQLIDDNQIIFNDDEATPYASSSFLQTRDQGNIEKIQKLSAILETLRIKLLELAHLGRKSNDDQVGLILSPKELETLDILVQTVRLVQQRFQSFPGVKNLCRMIEKPIAGRGNKRQKKGDRKSGNVFLGPDNYRITANKLLHLLLENFPVRPLEHQHSQNSLQTQYELSNAGICLALAELGRDVVDEGRSVDFSPIWVNTVFSYIFPRLAYKSNDDDSKIDDSLESNPIVERSEAVATYVLLKVVKKLLLPISGISSHLSENFLLKNALKRHELFEAFAGAFFPRIGFPSGFEGSKCQPSGIIYDSSSADDNLQRIEKLASSISGRTAALLVTSLNNLMSDGLGSDFSSVLEKKNHLLLLQMTSVLPIYLDVWKGLFPVESGLVLAFILSIVRQWFPTDNVPKHIIEESQSSRALTELCLGLRRSLDILFVQNTSIFSTSRVKKRKKGDKNQSSIFENLPETVQKLCIGLIGMLKSPTEVLAKSLSIICAKSCASEIHSDDNAVRTVSAAMSNYITEVMSSLRKSMPMPTYITFLLDSSGIQRAAGSQIYLKQLGNMTRNDDVGSCIFCYDKAIEQLTRFLTGSCENATAKVLPMIRPVLENWLAAASVDAQESISISASDVKKSFQIGTVIKQLIQTRASLSILAAFALDEITKHCHILNDYPKFFIPAEYLELDENLEKVLLDSILSSCEMSAVLWLAGGGQFDDSTEQHLFLAQILGPSTVLLRYCDGMLKKYLKAACQRVSVLQKDKNQHNNSSSTAESLESVSTGNGTNMTEVHISALLLILKSKEPVSISNLIVRNEALQITLLEVSDEIERIVKGGHLANLGGKLQHQAKLICELGLSKR